MLNKPVAGFLHITFTVKATYKKEIKSMSDKKMNIFQRMSAISNEVTAVAKNLNVGVGKGSYKAVGDADVLAAVKPLLAKYGVYAYPYCREIVESGTLEKDTQYGKSVQLYLRMKTTFRFINLDDPTDYIEVIGFGDGVDTCDKAPGKAQTYSDKYCILRGLLLVTGEDPDQYKSEPVQAVKTQKTPKPPKDTDRMMAAYPPREEMERVVSEHWKPEALEQILKANGYPAIEALPDVKLVTLYNKASRGTQNNG